MWATDVKYWNKMKISAIGLDISLKQRRKKTVHKKINI